MASHPDNGITRRSFLARIIAIISGIIGVAVATPLIGYFLSPAWKRTVTPFTAIARTGDIPRGEPAFVTYEERARDGWFVSTLSKGAWVVNKDGKEFIVLDPRCTHLNCPYYWDKDNKRFQCPCHDGRFDIDGNVTGGPPPRPLDRLESRLEGDVILVGGVVRSGR